MQTTAKIRIHRARQRLAEALRQECDFYRDSENVLRCDPKTSGDTGTEPLRFVPGADSPPLREGHGD